MSARRAAAVGLAALLLTAPPTRAQSAGSGHLLASPDSWPVTGAVSGFTALGLDPSAVFLNPAGLSTQDERSLLFHHGVLAFDTSWDLAATSYPVPGVGAFGLGLARVGTSGIEAYDAGNRSLGTLGYSETALAAGIARSVTGPLHAGAAFKVVSQALGDVTAAAPAIDLGLVYRPSRLRGAQLGLSVQNLVAGSLDLGGPVETLDRTARVGAAGPEWRLGARGAVRAVADLVPAGADGMKSRLGLELARAGFGALRAGLSNGRPVFGVGVSWRRYGFDVALVPGELEMTQQFALRIAWGEPVHEYEARRREEFAEAAAESLRAARSARIAEDRIRAEEAEARGDLEQALVLWEVLLREDPSGAGYAERAAASRRGVETRAREAVERESLRRVALALQTATREALTRGDLEEAAGLLRAAQARTEPGGAGAESLAALATTVREARARAASVAVERGDSLKATGRIVAAVEEAALALRLKPGDPRARALWTEIEASQGDRLRDANQLARKLQVLTHVHEASLAFNEGRDEDADASVRRALALDPQSPEARAWRDRIARRRSVPQPEVDARIKELYVRGMEAFSAGEFREALKSWEQILVLDPLNESARRNILEARERLKAEARR